MLSSELRRQFSIQKSFPQLWVLPKVVNPLLNFVCILIYGFVSHFPLFGLIEMVLFLHDVVFDQVRFTSETILIVISCLPVRVLLMSAFIV